MNVNDPVHLEGRDHKIFMLYQFDKVKMTALSARFTLSAGRISQIVIGECSAHGIKRRGKIPKPQSFTMD